MSNSDLAAAGSSTYSSNTLHVGDGTWDNGRDTFLLPNLMGLNFETMRYNGMGNRFKDMAGYHSIIIAHGVIGTIVFLGIVPTSIFLIRYYSRWNPYWAFKLHAWCQVLTLLLTTVVFVLGWFAVGPERSLTNPHHGIGLAIYVLVIFQVFWGWFLHKRESKRQRVHVPLKLVLHRWLGRALALLGIAQIPLGLVLYGSPKVLFILFALTAFAYLVLYFILSYRYDTEGYHMGSEHGGARSHYTGPSEISEPHGHHTGEALAAGAAGAGLASMFRRRTSSGHPSHAYEDSRTSISDEKYSDESSRHGGGKGGGFGKKLLEIGALAGAGLMAKKFWDRRKKREDDAESGRYKPAHSRSTSHSDETLSRMEDGRPEPTHHTPLNRPPSRAPSRSQSPGSSYYYNSTYFTEPPKRSASHGVRNAVLGAGAFAAVKRLFSRGKKDDEEKRRLEDIRRREDEDEALQRANSRRRPQAGESFYPRRRASSYSETDLTETDLSRPPPPRHASHGESLLTAEPRASGAVQSVVSDMPPMPPSHQQFSGDLRSEAPHSRHSLAPGGAEFASGAAAGAALDAASRRNRSSSRRRGDDVASPPVSVKVKMHNDGRHVTLRRLTEEEAAASREARRRERRSSRRRNSSAGSLSGNEDASQDRWRRVEELERRQDEQMRREQAAASAQLLPPQTSMAPSGSMPASSWAAPPSQVSQMPPPPPIPAPSTIPYGAGSVTSPTYTGTEMSGSYANNRRRRRAERARTKQERQQQHGVEFT
ncbi:Cytochrome b561/ferric reductase transmembrane [Penicillium concentricum]|uniref:Cytochrome b561/ferric reductase transmembrane n=1 Tax=Penicillium concentricum TaxID=293559 RepID=A0A9W9V2M1_9EURO|nr:Cytochrome b561/ferric reductase transmembrane [Penicillium concentricum]KAJ5365424.1 Cytochrome b561/ferric reductase transmembrane [Penicillium concentricum]